MASLLREVYGAQVFVVHDGLPYEVKPRFGFFRFFEEESCGTGAIGLCKVISHVIEHGNALFDEAYAAPKTVLDVGGDGVQETVRRKGMTRVASIADAIAFVDG